MTGLTLAIKKLLVLIPGINKVRFHRKILRIKNLQILFLNILQCENSYVTYFRWSFGSWSEGPSKGSALELGIVCCSNDAVALDIVVTEILGLKIEFCKTNLSAIKYGYDKELIEIENNLDKKRSYDIKLPISLKVSFTPLFIRKFLANKIYVWPGMMK